MRYVVVGTDSINLKVWNFHHRRIEAVLEGHQSWTNSVVVTKNCKYVIACFNNNTIRVWKIQQNPTHK